MIISTLYLILGPSKITFAQLKEARFKKITKFCPKEKILYKMSTVDTIWYSLYMDNVLFEIPIENSKTC